MADSNKGNMDGVIRVMIVDDHPTVREGLAHRIESQGDMTVCGEAADVDDALRKVPRFQPDVVIVDIALKNSDGLELIKLLKNRCKEVRSLVHSMYDEMIYADRCLHAGALGYLNKEADPDQVIAAIRMVAADQVYLSPKMSGEILGRAVTGARSDVDPIDTLTDRQLEVFRLMGEGKTAANIGHCLHISVHTVETHRDNIKRTLRVGTISELTRLAVLWASKTC